MNSRERFRAYLKGEDFDRVPRIESKFAPETIERWRREGPLGNNTPEEQFELDRHESVPVLLRKFDPPDDPRAIWPHPEKWYDADDQRRYPADWERWLREASRRTHLVSFEPWYEGLFQILGVYHAQSLVQVLLFMMDEPSAVERVLDVYTDYLETIIARICSVVTPDYAVLSEPIASHQGPVISPAMAKRFLQPCYRRIVACLNRHEVDRSFIWTSGRIHSLIPLWLESGLTGMFVDQACTAGVDYRAIRRKYGPSLALMGGLDNAILHQGERAIQNELERKVPILLESGRYVPGLDDTVRPYVSFRTFAFYRESLNRLVDG